jgi:hypothetical protein
LLQALSLIYGPDTRQSNQHHLEIPTATAEKPRELEFNEVRIAKVEEWHKFPLKTQEQQQEWMRRRLETTRSPSEALQEGPAGPTSVSRKRLRSQITGPARERQETTSEGRSASNPEADQQRDVTMSTASPAIGLPVSEMTGGWAASPLHNDSLDPSSGTHVSNLRHTTTQSPALQSAAETSHNEISNTPSGEQQTQPEQYSSKAKRLVTLHSRKYF